MDAFESNQSPMKKRFCVRNDKGAELDKAVWEWFERARSLNVPVSGPLIKEKALSFAEKLEMHDFKASNGWLDKFKARHNLGSLTVCGERGSVDKDVAEDWKDKLPTLLEGYEKRDIFNMDESGLFYKALPDRTLSVKGDACTGGKKSKDRLTLVLTVNMLGDFEKPLVIGKSQKPRCFKHISPSSLPVTWKHNKKAWMTTSIYEEWLKSFNSRMRAQGRKVLLFVDNAPSHPHALSQLSNVKVLFYPPNATSVLQPLDQGIIKVAKQLYKKKLLRRVISRIDSSSSTDIKEVQQQINVYNAIQWISEAVKEVKKETVTKCFVKAGYPLESSVAEDYDPEDDLPLSHLVTTLRKHLPEPISSEEYESMDNHLECNDTDDWEDVIVSGDSEDSECSRDGMGSENEEDQADDSSKIKTVGDALQMLDQLKSFFAQTGNASAFERLSAFDDDIAKNYVRTLKQGSILTYFSKK